MAPRPTLSSLALRVSTSSEPGSVDDVPTDNKTGLSETHIIIIAVCSAVGVLLVLIGFISWRSMGDKNRQLSTELRDANRDSDVMRQALVPPISAPVSPVSTTSTLYEKDSRYGLRQAQPGPGWEQQPVLGQNPGPGPRLPPPPPQVPFGY